MIGLCLLYVLLLFCNHWIHQEWCISSAIPGAVLINWCIPFSCSCPKGYSSQISSIHVLTHQMIFIRYKAGVNSAVIPVSIFSSALFAIFSNKHRRFSFSVSIWFAPEFHYPLQWKYVGAPLTLETTNILYCYGKKCSMCLVTPYSLALYHWEYFVHNPTSWCFNCSDASSA